MNWMLPTSPRCQYCQRQMKLVCTIPGRWSFPDFFVFLCVDCTITETIEGRTRPQAIEHCGHPLDAD